MGNRDPKTGRFAKVIPVLIRCEPGSEVAKYLHYFCTTKG